MQEDSIEWKSKFNPKLSYETTIEGDSGFCVIAAVEKDEIKNEIEFRIMMKKTGDCEMRQNDADYDSWGGNGKVPIVKEEPECLWACG